MGHWAFAASEDTASSASGIQSKACELLDVDQGLCEAHIHAYGNEASCMAALEGSSVWSA